MIIITYPQLKSNVNSALSEFCTKRCFLKYFICLLIGTDDFCLCGSNNHMVATLTLFKLNNVRQQMNVRINLCSAKCAHESKI